MKTPAPMEGLKPAIDQIHHLIKNGGGKDADWFIDGLDHVLVELNNMEVNYDATDIALADAAEAEGGFIGHDELKKELGIDAPPVLASDLECAKRIADECVDRDGELIFEELAADIIAAHRTAHQASAPVGRSAESIALEIHDTCSDEGINVERATAIIHAALESQPKAPASAVECALAETVAALDLISVKPQGDNPDVPEIFKACRLIAAQAADKHRHLIKSETM